MFETCCIFTDAAGSCHPLKGGMRKGDGSLVDGQQIEVPGENDQKKKTASDNTELFSPREAVILVCFCKAQCWLLLVASLMFSFKRVRPCSHKTRMKSSIHLIM